MDYAYYILAVLVIGLLCLCVIRIATRSRRNTVLLDYQKTRQKSAASPAPLNAPWGWPHHVSRIGHRNGVAGSGALRSFADRLMREKQVVGSMTADLRYNNSIRALLEDRYGRVNREHMAEIEYQKVKRPLLRDPSEPHDQLDNLGTAEAERIRRNLQRMTSMRTGDRATRNAPVRRYIELKDIRQPWGW